MNMSFFQRDVHHIWYRALALPSHIHTLKEDMILWRWCWQLKWKWDTVKGQIENFVHFVHSPEQQISSMISYTLCRCIHRAGWLVCMRFITTFCYFLSFTSWLISRNVKREKPTEIIKSKSPIISKRMYLYVV